MRGMALSLFIYRSKTWFIKWWYWASCLSTTRSPKVKCVGSDAPSENALPVTHFRTLIEANVAVLYNGITFLRWWKNVMHLQRGCVNFWWSGHRSLKGQKKPDSLLLSAFSKPWKRLHYSFNDFYKTNEDKKDSYIPVLSILEIQIKWTGPLSWCCQKCVLVYCRGKMMPKKSKLFEREMQKECKCIFKRHWNGDWSCSQMKVGVREWRTRMWHFHLFEKTKSGIECTIRNCVGSRWTNTEVWDWAHYWGLEEQEEEFQGLTRMQIYATTLYLELGETNHLQRSIAVKNKVTDWSDGGDNF